MISHITITGITKSLAVISWTTNEEADSLVDYGTGTSYGKTVSDSDFVLGHSIVLTGLLPWTAYHFRSLIHRCKRQRADSQLRPYFTTLSNSGPDASASLSNIRVNGITDRLAVVSWETDEPANSVVEYGTTGSYGLAVSDGRMFLSHEFVLDSLAASTVYHFRVELTDPSGNGPTFGENLTFRTASSPDTTPPTISNIHVTAVTGTSAIIQWETDEISDSNVVYGTTQQYGLSFLDITYTLRHGVALEGLTPDATYHFQVQSADPSGNTARSSDIVFKTAKKSTIADTKPPILSAIRVAGVTDTKAIVLWSTDELSDSRIDYGTTTNYNLWLTDTWLVTIHSVELDNLQPATTYHMRISSTDRFGNGPATSGDIVFTTTSSPDITAPTISNIRVTRLTGSSATVSWTTGEPANTFIEYGTGGSYNASLSSGVYLINHTVHITGLKPSTSYHFRIGATDPSGNKAVPSDNLAFTTAKELPAPRLDNSVAGMAALIFALILVAVIAIGLFRTRRKQ